MGRSRRKRIPEDPVLVTIESLSHEGRGVARIEGKTTFIRGALAGEQVWFRYTKCRRNFDEGVVTEVVIPAADRVAVKCHHFGLCGGCSLQHLSTDGQHTAKQQQLLDNLQRIGEIEVSTEQLLPIMSDVIWGYRRKARLGVKNVPAKGGVLVGFREAGNSYLTDMHSCPVLAPIVGERISALRDLIGGMDASARIAQIEVAVGDDKTVLVLRNLDALSAADKEKLKAFALNIDDLTLALQPAGPESVKPLIADDDLELNYSPDGKVKLYFSATDFVQVNAGINKQMVARVLELLELAETDRVLDLFCGLGNFTLPMAKVAQSVVGVEGEEGLVDRAKSNAKVNNVSNAEFYSANLAKLDEQPAEWLQNGYNKLLLDPPRSGAIEVLPEVAKLQPELIVYVSCNPATLARDAGELVAKYGYKLDVVGIMDMFPHTAHVESIAVFKR